MIQIDKTDMNEEQRGFELMPKLEEFAEAVSLVKPLVQFKADRHCTVGVWLRTEEGRTHSQRLYRLNLFENGEQIGSISTWERYRQGNYEIAYGVESFRIQKHRGDRNTTFSKDIKVALRELKKAIYSRTDDELRGQIKHKVKSAVESLWNSAYGQVRWSIDTHAIATDLAFLMYSAHKRGENKVELGLQLPKADMTKVFELCENAETARVVASLCSADKGYAVEQRTDGAYVVITLDNNAVKKYMSYDELPKDLQDKIGVFKVLNVNECFAEYGVKVDDNHYYIVP